MRDTSTDFAWLNTGGTQGYDSMAHAAALMESMGIPYVGHRPLTYLITDSKPDAKDKMQSWGIPTPKSSFFGSRGKPDAHALQHLRPPFVVKPQNGSMSRNVRYAEDVKEALAAILEVRSSCGLGVLVEDFIGGTEITVAALGTFHKQDGVWSEHDDPLVLPILRRIGNHGKIFPSIQSINVRESTELYRGQYGDDVYRIAQLVYHAFRCRTAVRIDMILDETGTPYVIDINPKPDLKAPSETGDSFVNVAASAIGLDYDNLIKTILYDRLYHVLLDESPRWKEPLPWRVLKSLSS
jgi:D-alanine-D-alanine ligase